jgi:hypothetical protein
MAKKSAPRKSTTKSRGKSKGTTASRSSTTKRRTTASVKSSGSKRATSARGGGRSAGSTRAGGAARSSGGKVGSSRNAARNVAGRGDFGIEASNRRVARGASAKAKRRAAGDRDPDDRQPRAGTESREAGVGSRESGPGSGSGGDIDTDVVGVGDARGLSQSGPDDEADIGAADTTGGSEQFASGPPARGDNQPPRSRDRIRGTTHDRGGGDAATTDTSAGREDISESSAFDLD